MAKKAKMKTKPVGKKAKPADAKKQMPWMRKSPKKPKLK